VRVNVCQNHAVARFLVVVLPVPSHLNPTVAIGQALSITGHEVAYCGPRSDLGALLEPGDAIYPTGKRYYRPDTGLGMASIQFLWDEFVLPCNRFILDAVDRAMVDFRPDVVVTDQYALAGGLVAHGRGVRWVSLCTGMLELTPPPPDELPGLEDFVRDRVARVWALAGRDVEPALDLRFSPHLVIGLTTAALTADAAIPPQCALVGPALGTRPPMPGFAWHDWDPGRRHVLVTVGTMSAQMAEDFYRRMVLALEPLTDHTQALIVAPPELIPTPAPNVHVAPRVPVVELLPRVDAVVCHGGMNTVTEALAHGVPLVLAPMRRDQPTIARQVAAAGAGIAVPFASATAPQLRAAVEAVLREPSYRRRAQAVGDSFAAAGGARAAAAHLVALAGTGRTAHPR
jgi:UDP:flavonoid glycosyltransferase YjiC (YdhE family)